MGTSDVIIGVALDQSGSMVQGGDEVIDGFNGLREEQIAAPGNAYMTLVIFDGRAYTRFSAGKLVDIPELGTTGNGYSPGGSTPLYDGVMLSIEEVDQFLVDNPHYDGKKVIVVLTDGGENSSVKVTLDVLNSVISKRKEAGWEFIFLGSGGAAWTEGKNLEMAAGSSLQMTNNAQAYAAYGATSASMTNLRSTGQSMDSTLHQYAAASGIPQGDEDYDAPPEEDVTVETDWAAQPSDDQEMPHWGESVSNS